MMNIIKKEIDVEESLGKRLKIKPHKIIINNNVLLAFNYSNEIYINNLSKKIKINEQKNYINRANKTNDEYKNIQTLSITLNNADTQI